MKKVTSLIFILISSLITALLFFYYNENTFLNPNNLLNQKKIISEEIEKNEINKEDDLFDIETILKTNNDENEVTQAEIEDIDAQRRIEVLKNRFRLKNTIYS